MAACGLAWCAHGLGHREHGLESGERLADDPGEEAEAAMLGLPGRTTMVGSRMPTPSQKPRRV